MCLSTINTDSNRYMWHSVFQISRCVQLSCHITIAYKCQLGPSVLKYKIISQPPPIKQKKTKQTCCLTWPNDNSCSSQRFLLHSCHKMRLALQQDPPDLELNKEQEKTNKASLQKKLLTGHFCQHLRKCWRQMLRWHLQLWKTTYKLFGRGQMFLLDERFGKGDLKSNI